MAARLDEEKLEKLQQWAEGLAQDPRDEVRAAGKAILLLVEEVEMLHIDLWNARRLSVEAEAAQAGTEEQLGDLGSSLRSRLALFGRRYGPPASESDEPG